MLKVRSILVAVAAVSLFAAALVPVAPVQAATSNDRAVLAHLRVAPEITTKYDHARFKYWSDADANGCDTRQELLKLRSTTIVTIGPGCSLTGGTWVSPYDGKTWRDPAHVSVHHLVPLEEAWKSGASTWTASQREAFANDLGMNELLEVITAHLSVVKGGQDPASWLPPHAGQHCNYVTQWILVKYRWQLAIDEEEKAALTRIQSSCGIWEGELPPIVGPAPAPIAGQLAPVYRFWSDTYRGHFYTINPAERDAVILDYPDHVWRYEGVDYGAFTTKQPGTVPVHRFWSAAFSGHFYTTSAAERKNILATYPTHIWQSEGVAYYVYPMNTSVASTKPVARFWSATNRHHFYTADAAEAAQVRRIYPSDVWKFETHDFRVPTVKPSAAPLPAPTPTPPLPPVPTAPPNPGDTKDCDDFATWAAADAWFVKYYRWYFDVAKLDPDNDDVPCEDLPGAP